MTALRDIVVTDVLSRAQLVYVSRSIAGWWNKRKKPDELATFCGWYWVAGNNERGPYKTKSAAIRNAYFALILHEDEPGIAREALPKPQTRSPRRHYGRTGTTQAANP